MTVVDLYAGAGGWEAGARRLGLDPYGVELDDDAVAARAANGLRTVQADVSGWLDIPELGVIQADRVDLFSSFDPIDVRPLHGLIASPPCPAFSAAGNRRGVAELDTMIEALDTDGLEPGGLSLDARLLWHPVRWALELKPVWIALEQVPPVFPFWQALGRRLERAGWSSWSGVLNSADYGVPQTRRRAILIARRDTEVAAPPATHAEGGRGGLLPWVSMADALGWYGITDRVLDRREGPKNPPRSLGRPAPAVTASAVESKWAWSRPATTVACDARVHPPGHKLNGDDIERLGADEARARYAGRAGADAVLVTIGQAAALQSFPPGWRFAGTRTAQARQVGNACPALLAEAVLRAAVGAAR